MGSKGGNLSALSTLLRSQEGGEIFLLGLEMEKDLTRSLKTAEEEIEGSLDLNTNDNIDLTFDTRRGTTVILVQKEKKNCYLGQGRHRHRITLVQKPAPITRTSH